MRTTLSLILSSIVSLGSALFVQIISGWTITHESFKGGQQTTLTIVIVAGCVLSIVAGILARDRRSNRAWLCAMAAYVLTVGFSCWLLTARLP